MRVSDLAFAVRVKEIESITVHADATFIELPAMLISIFAASFIIEFISFFAFFAGSLLNVVVKAIWILNKAKVI